MGTWRARCGESRTSGSEGGLGKQTSRKAITAPWSDPTTILSRTRLRLLLPVLALLGVTLVTVSERSVKRGDFSPRPLV